MERGEGGCWIRIGGKKGKGRGVYSFREGYSDQFGSGSTRGKVFV